MALYFGLYDNSYLINKLKTPLKSHFEKRDVFLTKDKLVWYIILSIINMADACECGNKP